MKTKPANVAVTVCFFTVLSVLMLAHIVAPDAAHSQSERRLLSTFPVFSPEKLFSGALFQELEDYLLDQFVCREAFRGLKAWARYNLFRHKDNNDLYLADKHLSKLEYPLHERSISGAAEKFSRICQQYFPEAKAYYAVIPDKNYFLAEKHGYLSLDYERLVEIMQQNLSAMRYIDLFSVLGSDDYYRTDLHWSQEHLIGVADKLLAAMGNESRASAQEYTKHALYPFYGSYYGQAALQVSPDTLTYLTNSTIEEAVVFDHQSETYGPVYRPEKFNSVDPYDLFLSGPKPLLTISNPACNSDRELIIFRDSFGSSIAPLLLTGYAQITLVDLRYLSSALLGEYIPFSPDRDVLFLYNTLILNHSAMLK